MAFGLGNEVVAYARVEDDIFDFREHRFQPFGNDFFRRNRCRRTAAAHAGQADVYLAIGEILQYHIAVMGRQDGADIPFQYLFYILRCNSHKKGLHFHI